MQGFDPSTNPLNGNEWSFPLVEIIHIASFAMSVGTIAIVDLRLLDLGMRKRSAAQLVQATEIWTQWGILLAVMSGAVLVTTDPANYLRNSAFRWKMALLAGAIVYNYTVHRRVASSSHGPWAERAAGGLSVILWLSVIFCGIFYAFI